MVITRALEQVIVAFDEGYQINNCLTTSIINHLKDLFPGHRLDECVGHWQGTTERSWWITGTIYSHIEKYFPDLIANQQCVLRIPTDGKNLAYLEQCGSGATVDIGRMHRIDNPKDHYGWTFNRATNQYWACY